MYEVRAPGYSAFMALADRFDQGIQGVAALTEPHDR